MAQHIVQEEFNLDKFRALVHYICAKCDDPRGLNATKLHKALWFSDRNSYILRGVGITGERYIKRQYGPFSTNLDSTVDALMQNGAIVVKWTPMPDPYTQKQFIALRDPDLSPFTADEISIVDAEIEYVCMRNTAKSISEKSHDDIWNLAEIGEELPLYTALASVRGEVTEDDIAWAKKEYSNKDRFPNVTVLP